jgi:FlaA1/EpsC-like NDP-sugar epimerase
VGEKATIVPVLGDLRDREYTHFILNRLKADVIFHCAAYKHVPMLEENPVEALKNNVFGTRNIADAASAAGASRFVLISTDKAVNPSCVYGASKSLAEEIVLSPRQGKTAFMVVRFGNVLGSRGSIVPLFHKQIMKGGPVTVTHPEMTRFFMTIPEASSLVLKAGGVGEGGHLYILDMGGPIKITDLAKQMIRFYGFEPDKDIPVIFTGVRPGEKLTETLWAADEIPRATPYAGISMLERKTRFNGQLESLLDSIWRVCYLLPGSEEDYRNRRLVRDLLTPHFPRIEVPQNEPTY